MSMFESITYNYTFNYKLGLLNSFTIIFTLQDSLHTKSIQFEPYNSQLLFSSPTHKYKENAYFEHDTQKLFLLMLIDILNLFPINGYSPYDITFLSNTILVLLISVNLVIGAFTIGTLSNGISHINIFWPPNISHTFSILIIPLEILSYFLRTISLSLRFIIYILIGNLLEMLIFSKTNKFINTLLLITAGFNIYNVYCVFDDYKSIFPVYIFLKLFYIYSTDYQI